MGFAAEAMVQCEHVADFEKAWLSSLAIEGGVIYNEDETERGPVMESNRHGCMVWRGTPRGVHTYRWLELAQDRELWTEAYVRFAVAWGQCPQ